MNHSKIDRDTGYQGPDECVFRKTTFERLLNTALHVYHFHWNHDDDYYTDKNLNFMTSASSADFDNLVSWIKNSFPVAVTFINDSVEGIFFQNNSGLKGVVLIPNRKIVTRDPSVLNRNFYNTTLLDLKRTRNRDKLSFLQDFERFPLTLYYESIISALSYELRMTVENFLNLLYENTFCLYMDVYDRLDRKETFFNEIQQKKNPNHIELFAAHYYLLIRILTDYLSGNRSVSFHDVGTELAYLPAMIMELTSLGRIGLNIDRIKASDCVRQRPEQLTWIQHYKDLPHKINFSFDFLDLLEDTSTAQICDITVNIDVLEHLPDEKKSMEGLRKLWNMTKNVLIVHVPIETEETMWYDHNILFDREKIIQWASKLPDADFLVFFTDNGEMIDLLSLGYLVVFRKRGTTDSLWQQDGKA